MDERQFDRLSARLGAATSRRAGLTSIMTALTGLGASVTLPDGSTLAGNAAHTRMRKHRPSPAGPCGDRGRKANACRKNDDCCTGVCDTSVGKTNLDGKGRCRCMRKGGACSANRNCCGSSMKCINGACRKPGACTATVCASGCPFTSVNAAYAAAADGATIYIGPGAYPTGFEVNKSITLAACGGTPTLTPDRVNPDAMIYESTTDTVTRHTVTLQGLNLHGSDNPPDTYGLTFLKSDGSGTVTFVMQDCAASDTYGVLSAGDGDHVVQDCTISGMYYPVYVYATVTASLTLTGTTISDSFPSGLICMTGQTGQTARVAIDNCNFVNIGDRSFDFWGIDDNDSRTQTTLSITNTTFSNSGGMMVRGGVAAIDGCSLTGRGPTSDSRGLFVINSSVTVTQTTFSGFVASSLDSYGGGVYLLAGQQNSSLTLGAGVVITDNTAADGSGVAVKAVGGGTATVTGASSSKIYGNNTGDDCEQWDGSAWQPVVNCAFP